MRLARVDVFRNPGAALGHMVTVCGYMPDVANIERSRESRYGLAVDGQGREIGRRLGRGERRLCLEGRIFRTGCGEEICSGWSYAYGIQVVRVTNP